jgi:hypothetical protein
MACTIDHLRPDHNVRVLRNFTDARGHSHSTGVTGIIRQMGLDWEKHELWIDWDRNGVPERLCFALSSTTGPGNGRMRDYFEVSAPDPVATKPAPSAAVPKMEPPRRPRGLGFGGQHPPAETLLGEVAVACDCDPALHRAVLIELLGVKACLRCGTVTCTRSIGDDGRHTGNSWQAYLAVAVSPSVLDWLSRWPRVTVRRHLSHRWPTSDVLGQRDVIYLPADTRCETVAELIALEDARLGRTYESDFPTAAPPPGLPKSMEGFAQFWSALRLTPESDLTQLLAHAQLANPGSAMAVARLLRRPDAYDVMVNALRGRDAVSKSAGIAMARSARPVDPRLSEVLIEIMNGLSLEPRPDLPGRIVSWGHFEALLVVIADLKLATPEMFAALTTLQRRLVRHDADLVSCITTVLRELRGEPPPTHWGPWLP